MGGEGVGGGGGSCKYDEWGYFQSEGVNVTVYPSLCHYNGTLYNGNWELGANIGAIILGGKIDCNYCWDMKCVLTLTLRLDSNLYRCGIIKLTLVRGTKTWPGHQDMSTSEARKYVICCFVMSTCVTFLIFSNCNGPHHCHVMCHVTLIMSAKQSSYDDFYVTNPRNPLELTHHFTSWPKPPLELYNSHVKAFLHLKTNGASLERLNLKVKLLSLGMMYPS